MEPCTTHGEQDDDERDPVDRFRLGGAADDGERGEQDRHCALEPAPHDEAALAPAEPKRNEQRETDDRANHEGEQEREQEPCHHRPSSPMNARFDGEAECDESGHLGQAGERAVEPLDLVLVRGERVTDHDPRHEDGEEARSVRHRSQPVDEPASPSTEIG